MIKPKKLKNGDRIGVIAPASPAFDKSKIDKGAQILERMGYKVVLGESCLKRHGYLAGDDFIRAKDVNSFFKDEDIDAIICLRGGYGSMRILDMIDYKNIKENPKIFCGYSDITAMHAAINRESELITFHGPMVASDISDDDEPTIKSMIDCLSGNLQDSSYKLGVIRKSDITGRICGGNLSLICALIGTKYEINFKDSILFIEDIGEEPYRIDRMLQQIKLSGAFKKLKGVVLGQFTDCNPREIDKSLTYDEVIDDFFSGLDIPVYYGLPAGHETTKITVPIGIKVRIENGTLYFTEECVK